MATPAQRTNTWTLNEWYDQAVAGTQGTYVGEGQLYTLGRNSHGELGQNTRSPGASGAYSSPVQVPGNFKLTTYGDNGTVHGIKDDNTLWAWGDNEYGQLGLNDAGTGGPGPEYSSPTQVPGSWSTVCSGAYNGQVLAVRTNGTLWAWGYAGRGQDGLNTAGTGGAQGPRLSSPTQVGTDTTWSASGTGDKLFLNHYVQAIKTDGSLWGWGANDTGLLGLNTRNPTGLSSPTQVGTDTTWDKVTTGAVNAFAFATKTDGSLWVSGYNNYGQLGQNNPTNSHRSSPVQIPGTWSKAGGLDDAVIGLKTNGTLWGWGRIVQGNLGLNEGGNPGVSLSSPTQIGTNTNWESIVVGWESTWARKTDGSLWWWGSNDSGSKGYIAIDSKISSPTQLPGTDWASLSKTAGRTQSARSVLLREL